MPGGGVDGCGDGGCGTSSGVGVCEAVTMLITFGAIASRRQSRGNREVPQM